MDRLALAAPTHHLLHLQSFTEATRAGPVVTVDELVSLPTHHSQQRAVTVAVVVALATLTPQIFLRMESAGLSCTTGTPHTADGSG